MVKNYFINPCCKLLFERVAVIQLVNKFPAFPGTSNISYWIGKHRHITIPFSLSTVLTYALISPKRHRSYSHFLTKILNVLLIATCTLLVLPSSTPGLDHPNCI